MSEGKLPPISFYTRREKTLMGLKFQKSVYLPKRSSRPSLHPSVYFHGIQNNVFLPDNISKASSQKLSRNYRSSRESVRQKNNVPPLHCDVQGASLGEAKKHFSIHPNNVLYRNIPEGVQLRRNNSKLTMKVKTPTKLKKLHPPPATKYAQLHKLGLEENLNVHSDLTPGDLKTDKIPRVGSSKFHEHDFVESSKVSRRNVTQTFRLDSTTKNCVYPVQFQPDGLPYKYEAEQNEDVPDQNDSWAVKRSNKDNAVDDGSSKCDKTSVTKVELGNELKGITPSVTRWKHENRDLYPIFDWTQQKRDDAMRVRFLDPVLKDFDKNCNTPKGRTPFLSHPDGLPLKQSYEDIYRFVPDKMNIELDWKLIKQHRTRVRKPFGGTQRLPSPSFSPLLNPPPTAMEFNISDLETLLELERSSSSAHSVPIRAPTSVSVSVPFCDTDPQKAGLDTDTPAISGTACKPVSTALALAKKTKLPETTFHSQPAAESHVNGTLHTELDTPGKTVAITDDTCQDHKGEVRERGQQRANVKKSNTVNDPISDIVLPEEHPIQVVIKVIPSIAVSSHSEDGYDDCNLAEKGISSVLDNKTIIKKSSSAFLEVPRIDVSFEGRIPDKAQKLPSPRYTSVTGSSVDQSKMNTSPGSRPMLATCEADGVQTSRSLPVNLTRKHVPNKNIVFISPAVENVAEMPEFKLQK